MWVKPQEVFIKTAFWCVIYLLLILLWRRIKADSIVTASTSTSVINNCFCILGIQMKTLYTLCYKEEKVMGNQRDCLPF